MKIVREKLVDACIVVTVTLALLLGLELAVRMAKHAKGVFSTAPEGPSTILKQPWGRQYESDEKGLRESHADYVEFMANPYRSKTVTVDEERRRRVPGNCERATAFTVWMFGGSTMFGYGAPDEFTIPAYLAELLNRGGKCAKVINFGAASWQSSQELIQLIESLKRNRPPHAAIFYDGVNDSDVIANGVSPGGIDPNPKALLDLAFRAHEISILEHVAQRSALVGSISSRIFGLSRNSGERANSTEPAGLPERAKAVAAIYAQNVRVVDLLAREYGFSAYFFLQPYPQISQKKLTRMESDVIEATLGPSGTAVRDMTRASYRAFGEEALLKAHPRYFDISGIFDGLTDEIFADNAHLLPEGNRIVAERIAREIVAPPVAK